MRAVRRVGFSLVSSRRFFGKAGAKVASPPLVVITGEEFTRYAGVSDQRSFCVALKVFFFFFFSLSRVAGAVFGEVDSSIRRHESVGILRSVLQSSRLYQGSSAA
jgi:hypothetical protein